MRALATTSATGMAPARIVPGRPQTREVTACRAGGAVATEGLARYRPRSVRPLTATSENLGYL